MRVLIFSESQDALKIQAELQESGGRILLRNPQFFRENEFEPCDRAIVPENYSAIYNAYFERGVPVQTLESIIDGTLDVHGVASGSEAAETVEAPKLLGTGRKRK